MVFFFFKSDVLVYISDYHGDLCLRGHQWRIPGCPRNPPNCLDTCRQHWTSLTTSLCLAFPASVQQKKALKMQPCCAQQPNYAVPRLLEIYEKPPSQGHLAIINKMLGPNGCVLLSTLSLNRILSDNGNCCDQYRDCIIIVVQLTCLMCCMLQPT